MRNTAVSILGRARAAAKVAGGAACVLAGAACMNEAVRRDIHVVQSGPPETAPFVRPGPPEPGVSAPAELTAAGAVARAVAIPTRIDTLAKQGTKEMFAPRLGPGVRPRFFLPDHALPANAGGAAPPPNGDPVPQLLPQSVERTTATERLFPGITSTGWNPPDPTLAVGPSHVVSTVNSRVAWHTKEGVQQFAQDLQPFFASVNAGGFCFDPKCVYDHLARRYVVLALETYGTTEAWITIAVSDDDDPNGVWYRYRTDAVITVNGQTFWWDYPGLGYDANGIYVTGNLFGLSAGGWAGVGYRVFDKASLYAGQPAQYSTLRDGGSGSVQVAQCFGSNPAPYFVSHSGSGSVKVQAITNPLTSPVLVTRNVTVPAWAGPGSPPAAGNQTVSTVDDRIFNVCYRDGSIYATHNITASSKTVARWYHIRTNNWPTSGQPSLAGSGNIDPGVGIHSFFPVIYANRFGDLGIVVGTSSSTQRIAVGVAGRPAGQNNFGGVTTLVTSGVDTGGRWGDYYDIAVDPNDDTLFWVVGEYGESFGWSNWIASFRVGTQAGPTANPDQMGTVPSSDEAVVDVLANDTHFQNLAMTISAFDRASVHGGTVRRVVGGGAGGRDALAYRPPTGYTGPDSFMYSVTDSSQRTSRAAVTGTVLDTSTFRSPENPDRTVASLDAAYYVAINQTVIPNLTGRTPYLRTTVPDLNFAVSGGVFANSTRADNLAAAFTGYIDVPATDIYTFYTESDEGSKLWIGDTLVVDNDGAHTMRERSGTIGLLRGVHAFRVEYFERTLTAGLIAKYQSGTLTKRTIPAAAFRRPNPCGPDFNNDGFLDFFDYDDFVTAYQTGEPAADYNEDGFLDFFDYDDFVGAFEAGC